MIDEDEGIGSITLVGLCTDICVISNALLIKASLPEVPICVDATCCAGVTPESHENALKAMERARSGLSGKKDETTGKEKTMKKKLLKN